MHMKLTKTIVAPPLKVRRFDLEKEGPVVDGAARFETPMDLEARGYTEEEYLVAGVANIYTWPDKDDVPEILRSGEYCTRIIVRKPENPADFSGIVAFESFNGSFTIDHCNAGWGLCCEEIMNAGDAWVGYTKDGNCLESLRMINPKKYGEVGLWNPLPEKERGKPGWDPMFEFFQKHNLDFPLTFDSAYERGLVYDMVFQIMALVKSGRKDSPFRDYNVKKVIGIGINDYNSYIAGFQDLMVLPDDSPVIDGYLMYMSGGGGWISFEEDMFDFDDPRCSKRCNVPVIRVETAGDLTDIPPHPFWGYVWRCGDSDEEGAKSRWYEIPGLSVEGAFRQDISCFACDEDYEKRGMQRRKQQVDKVYWNQMCLHIYAGAYHNLKSWVLYGKEPPKAEYIHLKGVYPEVSFEKDALGNHIGGIRHPYVEVPVAAWSDGPEYTFFDRRVRDDLYRDQADYVERVRACAEKMVDDGWILPWSAEMLIEQAKEIRWEI